MWDELEKAFDDFITRHTALKESVAAKDAQIASQAQQIADLQAKVKEITDKVNATV